MKEYIFCISMLFVCSLATSQENYKATYFNVGAYLDVSGEFIFLHYYRAGVQRYVNKKISLQASLKFGSRSNFEASIPSELDGIATNWINWHQDNPSGNPVILSAYTPNPKKFGISQYNINDHSLFYANMVISAGWDIEIFERIKLQIMGGVGLRYTDEHFIGESGGAFFHYNGIEYELYYLVPVFQRGFDSHLNFELTSLYQISDNILLKAGVLSDLTLVKGVGNYMQIGGSVMLKI